MVLVSWLHSSTRVCWFMGTYNLLPIHARPSLSESSSLCDWNHLSFDRASFNAWAVSPATCSFGIFFLLPCEDWCSYLFQRDDGIDNFFFGTFVFGHLGQGTHQEFFFPGEVAEGEVELVEILSPPDLFSHANVPAQQIGIITENHLFLWLLHSYQSFFPLLFF